MKDLLTHWEKVYQNRPANELSWYQADPTASLLLIGNAGLPGAQRIIDIGGGASRLVDALLERGYPRPAVLDISATALAGAQERLGERADLVDWYLSEVTLFRPPHRFTIWHDRAVFHFLTDPRDQEAYTTVLRETLAPDGQVVLASFTHGAPPRCSNLEVKHHDEQSFQAILGREFQLVEVYHNLHITPSNQQQPFIYCRFLRRSI
ncbi:Methyltransf_11 domain-containing protein [Gammaproteobacteria bacterium]